MRRERIQQLLNRSFDGELAREEQRELHACVERDPLLRAELDELKVVHRSLGSLFGKLELPRDFSASVMKRIQPASVPADRASGRRIAAEFVPVPRKLGRRSFPRLAPVRKREWLGPVLAGMALAAALFVAVGALTGVFGSLPRHENTEPVQTGSGSGGPGADETLRTDSSNFRPALPGSSEEADVSSGDRGEAPANGENENRQPTEPKNGAREVVDASEGEEEGGGETPESKPPVVIEDPDHPKQPVVETPPDEDPVEEPTRESGGETVATVSFGRAVSLSGRLERRRGDGSWERLPESADIFEGDRIRTSINGVVLLYSNESGACVSLGRDSELIVLSAEALQLDRGEAALERDETATGAALSLFFDDYAFTLDSGAAVLSLRLHEVSIEQLLGASTLWGDEASWYYDGGLEVEVPFDGEPGEAEAKTVRLPDWAGDARAEMVLAKLEPEFESMELSRTEQRTVDQKLRRALESLLRQPVPCGRTIAFLMESLRYESFHIRDLATMIGEIEAVVAQEMDYPSEEVLQVAIDVIDGSRDARDWVERFRLAWQKKKTPLPPPRKPACQKGQAGQPRKGGSSCPKSKVAKRVDRPQGK